MWVCFNVCESCVIWCNLELVYLELDGLVCDCLYCELLCFIVLQVIEILWLWSWRLVDNLYLYLKQCYGEVLYDVVLVSGKGVIVVVFYFGNWELLNQWLVLCGYIVIVYKLLEDEVSDVFLQLVCGGQNVQQVCVEGFVVCQLFKVFKDGGVIGILFDQ